ncbi:MAG: hypothetical protein IPO53_13680 [Chitinophagaceae bacterium]|nr:hypothetical protein [Chitinophagaceae bacterium]
MENRKLASFPIYSDSVFWKGKYFKDIEAYYADNFPLREKWVNFSAAFRNSIGFQSSEIKLYDETNDAEANEKKDTTKESVNDGPLKDDGATGEIKKRVFVFKNRAFEMFGGGPAMGKSYADVINSYNKLLSPAIQVYNLIIPVALEFEITEKYAKLQKPNRPAIEKYLQFTRFEYQKVWAIDEIKKTPRRVYLF